MEIWVLIYFVFVANENGPPAATESVEFAGQELCESAKVALTDLHTDEIRERPFRISNREVVLKATCLPTGRFTEAAKVRQSDVREEGES